MRALEVLRDRSLRFETIVVDNASSDETPQSIAAFPWVRYLRQERNLNFGGACNAGARAAQAPVTLLLNNDAYPLGDALTPILAAFERDEVVIAGGSLFFEDGVTQAAGLVVLPNLHWHYYCRNLPVALDAVNRPRDALGASGAAMALRTAWFVENGGFDESFVNGFEDVDLCLRAREQGRAIAYVPNARFAHYEAASAGRFAREIDNERRFYARWSESMRPLPKTLRGDVGAIAVRCGSDDNPLLHAARSDLEDALRAFGHPVAHAAIAPWRRFDGRFRRAASLAWFADDSPAPGIAIARRNDEFPAIRTRGAVELEVPFLPCAGAQRLARLGIRRSDDPSCTRVGVIGGSLDGATVITPHMMLSERDCELACVVHLGLADDAAFGNVLLAQAAIPAIVLDTRQLRMIFAGDVAPFCAPENVHENVARMVSDAASRRRYGERLASDARRRFSPRRSAIRVVDLLCAARFGLERPQDT